MTMGSDYDDVSRAVPSDTDAERLLARQAPADGSLAPVASLLGALGAPADAEETAAGAAILARLTDGSPMGSARTRKLAGLAAGKLVAVAAVTVLTAGAAAAATGTLPAPVQSAVADAVSIVGIDLPSPDRSGVVPMGDASPPGTSVPRPSAGTAARPATSEPGPWLPPWAAPEALAGAEGAGLAGSGPDSAATGEAARVRGWCAAYEASVRSGSPVSTAVLDALTALASGAGLGVDAFCAAAIADDDPARPGATPSGPPASPPAAASVPATASPPPSLPARPATPPAPATTRAVPSPPGPPSSRPGSTAPSRPATPPSSAPSSPPKSRPPATSTTSIAPETSGATESSGDASAVSPP
jgi:collagen type III alpha